MPPKPGDEEGFSPRVVFAAGQLASHQPRVSTPANGGADPLRDTAEGTGNSPPQSVDVFAVFLAAYLVLLGTEYLLQPTVRADVTPKLVDLRGILAVSAGFVLGWCSFTNIRPWFCTFGHVFAALSFAFMGAESALQQKPGPAMVFVVYAACLTWTALRPVRRRDSGKLLGFALGAHQFLAGMQGIFLPSMFPGIPAIGLDPQLAAGVFTLTGGLAAVANLWGHERMRYATHLSAGAAMVVYMFLLSVWVSPLVLATSVTGMFRALGTTLLPWWEGRLKRARFLNFRQRFASGFCTVAWISSTCVAFILLWMVDPNRSNDSFRIARTSAFWMVFAVSLGSAVVGSVVGGRLGETFRALTRGRKASTSHGLEEYEDVVQVVAANQSLVRTTEDLRSFSFAASHDLQEPLRMITVYSQLLSRKHGEQLDGQAAKLVETIVEGAERLTRLLADLRAYLEVGTESPQESSDSVADLNAALKVALQNCSTAIEESGAVLTSEHLPLVAGAEHHFVQVFQNLLLNAVKYRSAELPLVTITALQDSSTWRIEVRDNGIGIAAEHHQRVFAPFTRLHGRAVSGTGMGLAICQRIIERYGGRIWVESSSGGGSAFCFTLPVVRRYAPLTTLPNRN